MNIVIIDSGISEEQLNKVNFVCNVDCVHGKCVCNNDYVDRVGHGTAILDLFLSAVKCANKVSIYFIKITSSVENGFHIEQLIYSIEYIINKINCNVLLMCSGIKVYNSILEDKLRQLYMNNTIIFSAFDNKGSMSYPAAFDFVIGVDVTSKSYENIRFDNESAVNVLIPQKIYRVKWLDGKTNLVKGSSFACAYYAGLYINSILNSRGIPLALPQNRNTNNDNPFKSSFFDKREKAVAFPFNKEMHALALNEELLILPMEGYYDIRQSGKVGIEIERFLGRGHNKKKICNIEDIEWNDNTFKVFILGHCSEIEHLYNCNIKNTIIEQCKTHNKKLVLFENRDNYSLYGVDCCYFKIDQKFVPQNYGKMYLCNTPVLGIFGTSSRQGKFTLQLQLRKLFLNRGYRIGQLGTEPSSLLFGFDCVFPMGYESSVLTQSNDNISILNRFIHICETQNPDLIIVGSQSGTCPYNIYNLELFTLPQIEFILGTQPDVVVLCVNVNDDINYIKRTIKTIEGIADCNVIAISLFPRKMSQKIEMISSISCDEDYQLFKAKLQYCLNIPIFDQNESEAELLCDYIIDYLS